mmetsp:Transcript_36791/g.60263  ORF Transcript_36791/g.60263 Transcript_36791/m.60263 type:complete len:319 (+) Transcript_36791:1122-2078(+)
MSPVLHHLGTSLKVAFFHLFNGVHKLNASLNQCLLSRTEKLKGRGHLVFQHLQLLFNVGALLVQVLLRVRVLLGIGVESLDAELKLNVGGTDVPVNFLQLLLLLVNQLTQGLVQTTEHTEVLLVHQKAQVGKLLVGLVIAGLDGRATLGNQLLNDPDGADGQVAVIHCQLQQLLVLRHNVQELLVLHLSLLLTVVLLNATLHLLEPLSSQLLQLPLQILDLAPALLLSILVVLDHLLRLVLLCRKPLHCLGILQISLLDGVVHMLQIRLAPLLQAPLGVFHCAGLLVGLLLHLMDLGEHAVLIISHPNDTELVTHKLN